MQTTEHAAEVMIEGMDGVGWSNSEPAENAPQDVHPEINVVYEPDKAGWSNTEPHQETVDAEAAAAKRLGIQAPTSDDAVTVEPAATAPAKKTAARKTAKR